MSICAAVVVVLYWSGCDLGRVRAVRSVEDVGNGEGDEEIYAYVSGSCRSKEDSSQYPIHVEALRPWNPFVMVSEGPAVNISFEMPRVETVWRT
jgi:hypothetical protein